MAREIKRLFEQWDSRDVHDIIQDGDSTVWHDAFAWWRRVGVNPSTLITSLENVRMFRLAHEEGLRDTRQRHRNIRIARKALRDAAPLIRFLKDTEAVGDHGSPERVFGDLGERVERAIQSYISEAPSVLRRGRPREPWLDMFILAFGTRLMFPPPSDRRGAPRKSAAQSAKGTIRAIEDILKLAGHGEVVTKERIRHAIRRIRSSLRSVNARHTPTTIPTKTVKSRLGSGLKR
jgi:hypothetical protein